MQRQAVGREALQTFPEWTVLFSHDKIHYDCVGPPTGTQFSLKRCQMNNKTTRYKVSPTLTHSSLCPRPARYLFGLFCRYSADGRRCLSHGRGDGLVSAPTQFPENPKHASLSTTAMAKCCGQ